ncbi:hypothetical protein LEP1GSC029_3104 [Leptospira interrogans str. 2002000626]|uniref:Uncharacterized protein n=1 Tax=Leptospira interrogans str. 2002000626 TaxID=996803 RepID=A0A829D1G4_LEPIR|nr:hypothetical protein LEP1GSC029_3104 [Leptospira interrogans str. 2002000626]
MDHNRPDGWLKADGTAKEKEQNLQNSIYCKNTILIRTPFVC